MLSINIDSCDPVLDFILKLGTLLGMVPTDPSTNCPTVKCGKLYSVLVVIFFSLLVMVSHYVKVDPLHRDTQYKTLLTFLRDVVLYVFVLNTVLGSAFWNRDQWVEVLRACRRHHSHQKWDRLLLVEVVASQVVYLSCNFVGYGLSVYTYGFAHLRHFIVTLLELYYQFYYVILIALVTRRQAGRYRQFHRKFSRKMSHNEAEENGEEMASWLTMEIGCQNLAEEVDRFCDLIARPFLLIVFSAALSLMDYTSDLVLSIKGNKVAHGGNEMTSIFVLFTIATTNVFLWFGVLEKESNKVWNLWLEIGRDQERALANSGSVRSIIGPRYVADGLYNLRKCTFLKVLGVVMTYVIVAIQFDGTMFV